MSLQIWLPLNGDLKNNGIKHYDITTLGTVSWPTEGKIGKCFQGGDGTQVANGISLNSNLTDILSNDYSIAVWIKPLGTHVHYNGAIISSGNWNQKTWSFGVSQDNTKVDVLSNRYNIYINCLIPINVWTHLVCIRKNNVIKLYKNGEYIDSLSGSVPSATLQSDANNTTIGRQTYAGGYFSFNGCINDLRIYDNALSQQQIKEISKGLILHYPLNRQCWGQENLLKASNVPVTNSSYCIQSYYFGDNPPQADEQITIQIKGHLADTKSYWYVYNSGGTVHCLKIQKNTYNENTGIYTMTGEWKTQKNTTTAENTHINVYAFTSSQSGESTIEWIKLERGNKATPWCPNAADDIYTTLGLNNNIQYDISGYQNNGIKWNYDTLGEIIQVSDTLKYNVSTYINSENNTTNTDSGTRYIYGNCVLSTPEYLTVTFWCKPIAGYRGGTGQGQFSLTNNIIGNSAGLDYDTAPMNHRDSCIDMCTSSGVHKTMNITFTANEWHHYAIVYDGRYGRVYKDGIATGQTLDMGSILPLKNMKGVVIGFSRAGGVWRSNKSYFSDFRLYVTALSAEDILSLYNNEAEIDKLEVDSSFNNIVGEGLVVGYMTLKQ